MNGLRPYQTEVILEFYAAIRQGHKRILLVAPTGSGKTVIAAAIIRGAIYKQRNVVALAHRREIIAQTAKKLRALEIPCGIIQAGSPYTPEAPVQVASISTLWHRAMRSDRMEKPPADLIVVDEAHHATARTWRAILDAYPNAIILGLTATPCRGDGRGLGGIFETMVECPQIAELIAHDPPYLVPTRVFAPSTPDLKGIRVQAGDYVESELALRVNTTKLVADIVTEWLNKSENRRTVCFATGVQHSMHIRDRFIDAGVRCEHIDGGTPKDERDAALARLEAGELDVVTNCMVLTEGWDQPPVSCCILARPTKQMGLYRQMVGRVLRPAPGKSDAIILDHSGAVFRHGLPEDHVYWTLDPDKGAENKQHEQRKGDEFGGPKLLDCSECGTLREGGKACPNCGFKPQRSPKAFVCAEGDLALVKGGKPGVSDVDKQAWYDQFAGYAVERGHKPGFAFYKFEEKFGHKPPRGMTAHAIPPTPEVRSWLRSRAIAWAKAQQKAQAGA